MISKMGEAGMANSLGETLLFAGSSCASDIKELAITAINRLILIGIQ
jgi:hypothetical protein